MRLKCKQLNNNRNNRDSVVTECKTVLGIATIKDVCDFNYVFYKKNIYPD